MVSNLVWYSYMKDEKYMVELLQLHQWCHFMTKNNPRPCTWIRVLKNLCIGQKMAKVLH